MDEFEEWLAVRSLLGFADYGLVLSIKFRNGRLASSNWLYVFTPQVLTNFQPSFGIFRDPEETL